MINLVWVPRSEWGASAATEEFIRKRASNPASSKKEIQVHNTAGIDTDDATPNRWDYEEAVAYMRRLQWSRPDLGPLPYSENVAVGEDLETVWVFQGRGVLKRGAHTGGHNVAGVGWGVLGNFDKVDVEAAQLAVAAIQHQAWFYKNDPAWNLTNLGQTLNPKGWTAWGHRDSSSKSCPGNSLYPLLEQFVIKPIQKNGDEDMLPLEHGDTGEDVTLLEELLNDTFDAGLSQWDPVLGVNTYDDATATAVKTYLGQFTNHPEGKEGKWVGGRQFAELVKAHAAKFGGSWGGGVTMDQVHAAIEASTIKAT